MKIYRHALLAVAAMNCCSFASPVQAQEYLNGIKWEKPPIVDPGKTNDLPPSDATVLFGGGDASACVTQGRRCIASTISRRCRLPIPLGA
jgi:hypothetical protein